MTYSEIMNFICKQNGITPQTHPRLFSKNGNFRSSEAGGSCNCGFMRLKREFLIRISFTNTQQRKGAKYTFRHILSNDQIDRLKIWAKNPLGGI